MEVTGLVETTTVMARYNIALHPGPTWPPPTMSQVGSHADNCWRSTRHLDGSCTEGWGLAFYQHGAREVEEIVWHHTMPSVPQPAVTADTLVDLLEGSEEID